MMDSEDSEAAPLRQLRRSTRQSLSVRDQAVNHGPTPRGPLKRGNKRSRPQPEVPAVNGTNDKGSDDDEADTKKSCLQTGDFQAGGAAQGPPKNDTEPMETHDESGGREDTNVQIQSLQQPNYPPVPGPLGDVHLKPCEVLVPRCNLSHLESESGTKTRVEKPKKKDASPSKHTAPTIPSKRAYGTHHTTVTSMADYKRKMESNIPEIPKVNHYVPRNYPKSVATTGTRRRTTDASTHKAGVVEETKKTPVSRQNAGASSKGFLWYFLQLVLLMLLCAGLLLASKHLPTLQRTNDGSTHSSRSANSGLFVEELSRVAMRFPSQRPELWKRSRIHLQKHLDHPHPTEPVSMILTAGVRAQKTLQCLAHNIASAFSSALNTSVVVIDGASQANLDSDQVKMDIDNQLKAAFEGDKLASVVQRFEELPPGSSLIFYRYCDHETAAYKRAFILFTVLLSEEDLSTQQSLKEVEELVRDHVEKRFVGSETAFNKMDADKFSGLWSRIAHLILPVAYEDNIELKGC